MVESPKKKPSHKAHILLVDDEKNAIEVYADFLRMCDYAVTTATNAAQAIQLAEGKDFDLVITDLWMPDMNGIELLKTLKQMRPTLSVIVITGYSSVQTAVQAMRAGAADYFPKPYILGTEARERIERVLMESKGEAENQSEGEEEELLPRSFDG